MSPFSEIVGQPRATGALRAALAAGRLRPSLIFHGPGGVGKLPTALALCRALLCAATEDRPCGVCSSCRRIDERALLHPDVRVGFPEKLSEFEKGESEPDGPAGVDLQERQAEAIRNPVWSLLIDRVRQSIGFLQRRPAEGALSVLILDQAHRMPAEAANALLKTLEEPLPHAVIILISPSYHALLPTLRSRCQPIPFQLVSRAAIASYLMKRGSIDPAEAALRAGLSGGRIGVALDLDLEGFRRRREILLTILEVLLRRGDPGIAVARAEEVVRGGEAVEGDLEMLLSLLRDLMVAAAVPPGAAAPLIHADLADRLAALAGDAAFSGPRGLEDLERTIDAIRHKGNRQLLIENFFLGLLPGSPPAVRPSA